VRVVAWGLNNFGQCNVPAPNADFVAVEAGGVHSLGLKADGTFLMIMPSSRERYRF
jgi:hypothetical protein